MRQFLSVAVVLSCACVTSQPVPEASSEYVPSGEVMVRAKAASFDKVRVRSTRMNLTKRTDGSWSGTFDKEPFDLSVDETSVHGYEFNLSKSDSTEGHTIITGVWQTKQVRIELDGEKAMLKLGTNVQNFPVRDATKEGVIGYGGAGGLTLKGEAASTTAVWPQFALALLSTM